MIRLTVACYNTSARSSLGVLCGMSNHEAWLKLYASTNPHIKLRALRGLLESSEPPGLTTLLDAFNELFGQNQHHDDPDMLTRDLRRRLTESLKQRAGPALVLPLLPYVQHPRPGTRSVTCDILGVTGDHRATAPLIACLDDPVPFVRRSAAFALGKLGNPHAGDAIKARYTAHPADDINVRLALESAMRALGVPYGRRS
jgi:hypothetical protein